MNKKPVKVRIKKRSQEVTIDTLLAIVQDQRKDIDRLRNDLDRSIQKTNEVSTILNGVFSHYSTWKSLPSVPEISHVDIDL